MDIKTAKKIYFIGIGGIGTSSIAQILNAKGKKISGSDEVPSLITKNLKLKKIKVNIGHNEKNINKEFDLVIYSPAIPKSNPELIKAEKLSIKTLSYPQALGELTKTHTTIAIAGTHGKSTTTAMTAMILEKGKLDPTVVIGTKIKQFRNKNYKVGKSEYLILEACEYKRSFLNINPDILVITNIEADHLDYYKDLKDYESAFIELIKKMNKSGKIIINEKNPRLKKIVKNAKAKILTWKSEKIDELKIKPSLPGKFNEENAKNAAMVGKTLGLGNETIEKAIKNFKGTWRRMEKKRKKNYTCTFFDDYGHHPTEIELTLNAIREKNPKENILCIFQPHQYSRTKLLLKDFGKVFYSADKVVIPNIYKVRDSEEDMKEVNTDDLINEINKNSKHKKAINGKGLKKTAKFIKENHNKFDIIITMGAGDIETIYKFF
jgi:UDP-N-acetylmuramate--alanine ligase